MISARLGINILFKCNIFFNNILVFNEYNIKYGDCMNPTITNNWKIIIYTWTCQDILFTQLYFFDLLLYLNRSQLNNLHLVQEFNLIKEKKRRGWKCEKKMMFLSFIIKDWSGRKLNDHFPWKDLERNEQNM